LSSVANFLRRLCHPRPASGHGGRREAAPPSRQTPLRIRLPAHARTGRCSLQELFSQLFAYGYWPYGSSATTIPGCGANSHAHRWDLGRLLEFVAANTWRGGRWILEGTITLKIEGARYHRGTGVGRCGQLSTERRANWRDGPPPSGRGIYGQKAGLLRRRCRDVMDRRHLDEQEALRWIRRGARRVSARQCTLNLTQPSVEEAAQRRGRRCCAERLLIPKEACNPALNTLAVDSGPGDLLNKFPS